MSLVIAPIFVLATLLAPRAAQAQNVSSTAMAGAYSVTLRVLPAESFSGPKAAMVRDSGAQPEQLDGPMHPNHHMVAFIKKNGTPVANAKVEIRYRKLSPMMGAWKSLDGAQRAFATLRRNELLLTPFVKTAGIYAARSAGPAHVAQAVPWQSGVAHVHRSGVHATVPADHAQHGGSVEDAGTGSSLTGSTAGH